MRAIDDFEQLWDGPRSSRFNRDRTEFPSDVGTSLEISEKARNKLWYLYSGVSLFYRGSRIPNLTLHGNLIWPQFEHPEGFLLCTQTYALRDPDAPMPQFAPYFKFEWTDINFFFVPKDFSRVEGCNLETTWTFVLESDAYPNLVEASKCLPISFIGIEDERRLLLNIKKIGWLRLTITLPPRRWQPTLRHPPVKIHPRQPRSFRLNKATARDGQRCHVGHTPEWRG